MTEKQEKFPSTFTVDNFSSTATLAHNEIKLPMGSVDTLNEKPYFPYEHRDQKVANTFLGALMHLIKSSLGTGILAIPFAFQYAGLMVGLIGTALIGLLCTHTIHMLVVASQEMCKKARAPSLGFAETAEAVFYYGGPKLKPWAKSAKIFVELALVLTYYVGGAVYVVFISISIDKLVSAFYPETTGWDQIYKAIILVPLILCCQIRELKYLVPFSMIANLTMMTTFGITLYYMFSRIGDVKIDDVKWQNGITNIPLFFSTVIFAMEGIGTIMPVENSMKKPIFLGCPGVLNTAMSIVVGLYMLMGFFGYLTFQDKTEPTITKNLPSDEIPAQIAQACISIAVFFTFMLQFYVPVDITWRRVKGFIPEKHHNISQILLRTGLVIMITGIAAAAGDKLGELIDLVGSVFFSTLGLTIPAVIDIILRLEKGNGPFHWHLIKNIIILLLAQFGLISGSYYAVEHMIGG